jgi:hypothetical protein
VGVGWLTVPGFWLGVLGLFIVLGLRASDQRSLYKCPLPTCQRVTVPLEAMLRRQDSLAWF